MKIQNDYAELQNYILNSGNEINAKNADLNKDSRINTQDLFELKKIITKKYMENIYKKGMVIYNIDTKKPNWK